MRALSPEQLSSIQDVLSDSASRMSAVLAVSLEEAEAFLCAARRFVSQNSKTLGARAFIALFDPSTEGQGRDTADVLRHINSGNTVIYLNRDWQITDARPDPPLLTTCAAITEQERRFGLVIQGTYAYHVLLGKIICEGALVTGAPKSPAVSGWHRPIKELDSILADHMEARVNNEKGLRYWYDKKNRILLAGPDGTESLFQGDLFWWLRNFVSDRLSVYAEPTKHGQDKTDIVVVAVGGAEVIEVKWLGVNESKTQYGEGRIDEGLAQVRLYLERDENLLKGHLVVYDARNEAEHEARCSFAAAAMHVRCGPPKVLFLESESPSKIARKRKLRS